MGLLTIGAFARAVRLTPKALRLYDELGLLRPAAVDPESGYRLYAPAAELLTLLAGAVADADRAAGHRWQLLTHARPSAISAISFADSRESSAASRSRSYASD